MRKPVLYRKEKMLIGFVGVIVLIMIITIVILFSKMKAKSILKEKNPKDGTDVIVKKTVRGCPQCKQSFEEELQRRQKAIGS